ncbi:ribonuclease R [Minwuia thermotolerans]|uniref:Ribonuclease R n=1 Tax=Minwuia thermotolerans TaxID=2056226 RepID=A0A2M9G6V9_9PROT|nr:ribonuclease R [Minwuia thermotolerans]PJK31440.1 ribonuclease R [Minwuia thermotolerans]
MNDGNLPTKKEIRDFIDESGGTAGKREVARAFGIKGQDRIWLKRVLKEVAAERGAETEEKGRPPGRLPPVMVLDVTAIGEDDDVLCRPAKWESEAECPRIVLDPDTVRGPAPKPGDQFLARLSRHRYGYEARAIRRLQITPRRILGVLQMVGAEGRVRPADRKLRDEMIVRAGDLKGARSGDLVEIEALPGRALGPRHAKVVDVLGSFDNPRAISLMSIQTHGIPKDFTAEALGEAAEALPVTELHGREDLRDVPLVTIDPSDARDHDDAVWAADDDDPENEGGFRIIVAIADVAHYVRSGSALDKAAQERGVSCYFPDRVAPMLPETLSADLCSLMPGEVRPVLAAEIVIDAKGRKLRHRFRRALMRSAANIAYEDVQAAIDGAPRPEVEPLLDNVLKPLFAAYRLLAKERDRRQPLHIELPERKAEIGEDGYIAAIRPRERLEAHKVIEEMMILANVCAAETLEKRKKICVYRVHEPPDPERLKSLKEFLETLEIDFTIGEVMRPKQFNKVLDRASGTDEEAMVNEAVLRAQTQAYYSTDNMGHFGLSLKRYAHFTSPIRRYADLLVHRALIDAMRAGNDGLRDMDKAAVEKLAEQTSEFERRAMLAERDAMDRFTAIYLKDQIGGMFAGRVSGVTRAGLFVSLAETGASGIVPMRTLGDDYYDFDEQARMLVGRRTGRLWRLGDPVTVKLQDAVPVTGGLVLEIVASEKKDARAKARPGPKRPAGGRPPREKHRGRRRR